MNVDIENYRNNKEDKFWEKYPSYITFPRTASQSIGAIAESGNYFILN